MNLEILQHKTWAFVILAIWELIWKGLALWKAARQKQKNWFVAILVFNTIGILPIVYLKFFSQKKKAVKKDGKD